MVIQSLLGFFTKCVFQLRFSVVYLWKWKEITHMNHLPGKNFLLSSSFRAETPSAVPRQNDSLHLRQQLFFLLPEIEILKASSSALQNTLELHEL